MPSQSEDLCSAAQRYGFFYVRGHGIPNHLIDTVFDVSRRFFAMDEAKKSEVSVSGSHRGFIQQGTSVMDGYAGADLKESYIWGLDVEPGDLSESDPHFMLAPNRWYSELPQMRTVLNEYFDEAHHCAMKILKLLAIGLGKSEDVFTRNFYRPTSRGSLIYYPPTDGSRQTYGVSPHTDFGCISLLMQQDEGLQVQTSGGSWVGVEPVADTLVVNVGDLLTRWSNGEFRSVPHCVVNTNSSSRYSVVVFVDPDAETVIDPIVANGESAKYEPVRCDAYIASRFDRSFEYRKEHA